MNVNQMRIELEKKYSKAFVQGKSDLQIIAVFGRLRSQNKI